MPSLFVAATTHGTDIPTVLAAIMMVLYRCFAPKACRRGDYGSAVLLGAAPIRYQPIAMARIGCWRRMCLKYK